MFSTEMINTLEKLEWGQSIIDLQSALYVWKCVETRAGYAVLLRIPLKGKKEGVSEGGFLQGTISEMQSYVLMHL